MTEEMDKIMKKAIDLEEIKEKEFKLIDKRNEMRKATFELATTDDEKVLITTIFMLITEQDKEWIRLLKEDLKTQIRKYRKELVSIEKCKVGELYTKKDKRIDNFKITNRIIALNDFEDTIDKRTGFEK